MSKTSESSTAKSIREKFDDMVSGHIRPPKGWKTMNQWCQDLKISDHTFKDRIKRLIELGKAKREMFRTPHHGIRAHYWIDTIS